MILDLTIGEIAGGVRFQAPGLVFRDLIPILRGHFAGCSLRFLEMESFQGDWPPEGSVTRDGIVDVGLDDFMDQAETLLLEGGGPLFLRMKALVLPDANSPDTDALLSCASDEDFLVTIELPAEDAPTLFRHLFRAVFQDHPGVARGLSPEDAVRLFGFAMASGGIHFNPEKWRPDPEGRVSIANLGTDFHFPCHQPPLDGRVQVIRLTSTETGVDVSDPFGIEVNDYLDRWYDRPVGCRKFVQAGLYGGLLILFLMAVLFWTRRC